MTILLGLSLCVAHAIAIQFQIASGSCGGVGVLNPCNDSNIGALCASTPDLSGQSWCCKPGEPACGRWAQTCSGINGNAGPDQIFCSLPNGSETWCCNANYETCKNIPGVFNLCDSNFANPYSNTTEQEALSIKSAYFATATSTTTRNTLTTASTDVSSASSAPPSTAASTTSGSVPASSASGAASSGSATGAEEKGSSGLSGGAIAGVVIGVLVAVAGLVAAAFFLGRKFVRNAPAENAHTQPAYGQEPKYGRHEMGHEPPRHELPHNPASHGRAPQPYEVP